MKPKVSVIMSVYNSADYLAESIESILRQSLADLEFIIVDDNSNDESSNIIDNYAANDSRITHLVNEENLGLTKSLNKALAVAKGKYIARQDADDTSLPKRLQTQYNYLESNSHIHLVGTNGFVRHHEHGAFVKGVIRGTGKITRTLPHHNVFFHTAIMFRNDGQKYREKFYYSQDYDFYLCLLRQGKLMENLIEPLIEYRISDNAISMKKSRKQALFGRKAREFYREFSIYGADGYQEFRADDVLTAPFSDSEETYSGTMLFLDYMCYYNKRDALALLLKQRRSLSWRYLLRKAIAILIPVSVLEYQHRHRS